MISNYLVSLILVASGIANCLCPCPKRGNEHGQIPLPQQQIEVFDDQTNGPGKRRMTYLYYKTLNSALKGTQVLI